MSVQFTTEQFSGPLDLLLSLIEDKKMSVSDIALSAVTEQFVRYVESLDEDQVLPEELADFLLIAAKLLLLKSRNLLPQFTQDEDEGASLADQLRLYQAFVAASRKLNTLWLQRARSVFRTEPLRRAEGFVPPKNVSLDSLGNSMRQLLSRLAPPRALPKTTMDKGVSLKDKISSLKMLITKHKRILFHHTLENARNKTEVIVAFLALLELVKQHELMYEQETQFGDIVIAPHIA